MRKAIGTSIRSASSELRKRERYRQQRLIALQNQENVDPDEKDEGMNDTNDTETMLNGTDDITDDVEDAEEEDDDEAEDEGENEDDDKEMEKFIIDDELDEDEDDE
jgi:hypothetical protein